MALRWDSIDINVVRGIRCLRRALCLECLPDEARFHYFGGLGGAGREVSLIFMLPSSCHPRLACLMSSNIVGHGEEHAGLARLSSHVLLLSVHLLRLLTIMRLFVSLPGL